MRCFETHRGVRTDMQNDWQELHEGIDIYRRYKETKQDLEARWQRTQQALERERLEYLSTLTPRLLILAAQSPWQAEVLARLERLDSLKGLSPDRIVALMLSEKPNAELAQVAKEVLVRMHESGNMEAYRELVDTLKSQVDMTRQDSRLAMEKLVKLFETFASSSVDVARAASGHGGTTRKCPFCGGVVSAIARLCEHCSKPLPKGGGP